MALSAKSTYDDATTGCPSQGCPSTKANEANDARTKADVGGIVMGAGLAFVVTGAVLWFTAPKAKASTASKGVWVGGGPGDAALGVSASGRF